MARGKLKNFKLGNKYMKAPLLAAILDLDAVAVVQLGQLKKLLTKGMDDSFNSGKYKSHTKGGN